MKKSSFILSLFLVIAVAVSVNAKSDGEGSGKKNWRQAMHSTRNLYLDVDPALVIVSVNRQTNFTDEQIRELRSLATRYQDTLAKNRGIAQDAREELDRAMLQDPLDENAVRKATERAILSDAASTRTRLQFWLEARQRLGKEPLTKLRQAMAKHLHSTIEDKSPGGPEIIPPQRPQLPAKD
jgi:Spy/CpxP family protein refolding chaperone